ncbi:MAG: peptidase S10 [Alphaproteobacteria bacterium]|nr:peptidase S10 [Alphaproteobacteria bacterium]
MRPVTGVLTAIAVIAVATLGVVSLAAADKAPAPATVKSKYFETEEAKSSGSVRAGFTSIPYDAVAGTLIVHPKGWDDAATEKDKSAANNPDAEASMFYVAYFRRGANPQSRPVMFLFNGGPGSSTVWLHMGAFGPRRVVTADDSHTPAAPYKVVDNVYSLLDVADLVFIDAPGTGFSRIAGKDKEKAFYGVDPDAYAFTQFVKQFLSKYGRWNSPKYLFGESYGTPRAAVMVNELEESEDIDFNGVILLSQILNFDLSADDAYKNPGVDLPYVIALPTYAATAWYHNKLPGKRPDDLVAFVQQVERFSTGEYAHALSVGNSLSQNERMAIANKLHAYTGLPVSYILRADLRIAGGEFEQNLQGSQVTTGRLDTRFSGPSMDPLAKEADYDPQSAAISSAYVSAFNDYVRSTLKFGQNKTYKPEIEIWRSWNFQHQPPGAPIPLPMSANVMPDLASAMKYNPDLKVMVNGGYFDLATPYYEGWYEMHHLAIEPALQKNIEFHYYRSGHMVYAHEESLKEIHDAVADFVRRTDNVK